MADQYVGFLPYGSSDSSIVFQNSLTSLAGLTTEVETTRGGTLAQLGGDDSDFDSTKGFRPQGPDGNGSAGYSMVGMTNQTLLSSGGQMCFEIEAGFFTLT